MLTAEGVYTGLLRDDSSKARPGAHGSLEWTLPGGRSLSLDWELRANAVWRFGGAFLRCPQCQRLATDLRADRGCLGRVPAMLGPHLRVAATPELQG